MKKKQSSTRQAARSIGSVFAHVQHFSDLLIEWGMLKMKQHSEQPEEVTSTEKRHPLIRRAHQVGKFAMGFIGELGESYYKHYEKLKRDEGMDE